MCYYNNRKRQEDYKMEMIILLTLIIAICVSVIILVKMTIKMVKENIKATTIIKYPYRIKKSEKI